ncbi:MAG: sugar phosphate isomerase/epimerase family protein [Planctomycetota bacterium]|jgi:hexulose-6-phosphate isomerase
MTESLQPSSNNRFPQLDRRELLAMSGVFGASFLASQGLISRAEADELDAATKPAAEPTGKRYDMKKAINMWALPYPDKMSLKECFELIADAGFDGVEVNYNLDGDISPEASEEDLKAIGRMARKMGIEISGVCSFLFWPYPLTSNDPERRARGRELSKLMINAAKALGTDNLLVVPGAVYIPWNPEPEPVPNDLCEQRAREAIQAVIPEAKKAGVSLNLENIFANGFLFSPQEMNRFVDGFNSDSVGVHFDTGNIMQFQFPEHWIDICGKRIRNVHLKEYSKLAGTDFTLESFRPLLDGTINWPNVLDAFERVGYRGYLTFEYFHPFPHWPEALVYQTSDSLDRMLGRKA